MKRDKYIQNTGKRIERFMYENNEYANPSSKAEQWIGSVNIESPSEEDRQRVLQSVETSLKTEQGRDALKCYLHSRKMYIHIRFKEADRNPSMRESKTLSRIQRLTKRIDGIV